MPQARCGPATKGGEGFAPKRAVGTSEELVETKIATNVYKCLLYTTYIYILYTYYVLMLLLLFLLLASNSSGTNTQSINGPPLSRWLLHQQTLSPMQQCISDNLRPLQFWQWQMQSPSCQVLSRDHAA